jgi:gluconate 5-dehydrogenase
LSDLFSLDGRVALVTGSSRGFGFAMAEALAAHGAQLALNGRDPAPLAPWVEARRQRGYRAEAAAFDVTDGRAAAAIGSPAGASPPPSAASWRPSLPAGCRSASAR